LDESFKGQTPYQKYAGLESVSQALLYPIAWTGCDLDKLAKLGHAQNPQANVLLGGMGWLDA
jgi:hypothetical protein